ncbi:hypothetical protein J537_0584 [Acinetobacter baumannii 1437282]|nr:hypothetical protein J537_0584 [Acinetobacter baumannii 1437282]
MVKKVDLFGKLIITYTFILALCFLLYALVVLPVNGAEKVNAIIGLLGWSATIYAPIAAFFLIDNWKDQTKYNATLNYITDIISAQSLLSEKLNEIRSNKDVFIHLTRILHDNPQNQNSYSEDLQTCSFTEIFSILENIRILNLKIMMYDSKLTSHIFTNKINGFDSYDRLESCIKALEACFFIIFTLKKLPPSDKNSLEYIDHIQRCFYINSIFSKNFKSDAEQSISIPDKYTEELNQAITNAFEDVKVFRRSMD